MSEEPQIIVVCDAGPLIHLDELECIDLLQDFAQVLVPETVLQEVQRHRSSLLSNMPIYMTSVSMPVRHDPDIEALTYLFTLHHGEREALEIAYARSGAWLLTDDTAARLAAGTLNIRAHGTIGIITRAIRREQRSQKEVLDILESIPARSTLFIKPTLLTAIIREIRENA